MVSSFRKLIALVLARAIRVPIDGARDLIRAPSRLHLKSTSCPLSATQNRYSVWHICIAAILLAAAMLVAPALGQTNKAKNERPKVEQLVPDPEFYEVVTESHPIMEIQMISQPSHNAMGAAYNTRLAIQKRVNTSASRAARAISELSSYQSLYEPSKESSKPDSNAKDEFGDIVTPSPNKLFVDRTPPMMIDLVWAVMVGSLPDQYLSPTQQKVKSVLKTDLSNLSNMSSAGLSGAAKVCLSNLFKYEKHHDVPNSYIESQRLFLIDLAQAAKNPLTSDFADHLMHQRFQEVTVGQSRQFWLHTPNDVRMEPLKKGQPAERTTIVEVNHQSDNIYTIRYFRLYQIGPPSWYVRLKVKKVVENGTTTYSDLPYDSRIGRLASGKWWTFLDGSLNEAAPYVAIGPVEEEVEVSYRGQRGAAPTIQSRDIPNRTDLRVEYLPSGSFGLKTVRPYDRRTDPPLNYQDFMAKVRGHYDAHPADGQNPLLVPPNDRPASPLVAQARGAEAPRPAKCRHHGAGHPSAGRETG